MKECIESHLYEIGGYLSFGGIDVYTDSEDEKASSSSDNEDSKLLM
jgi:hypothetical protein